jgi:hypothetical protein
VIDVRSIEPLLPRKCESTAKFAAFYPEMCPGGVPPPRPTPFTPPAMDAVRWDLV